LIDLKQPLEAPTQRQLERFAAEGYLVIPRLASPGRLAQLNRVVAQQLVESIEPAEYEADLRYPGAPAERDAPGGGTTRRLLQAYVRDALLRQCAEDPTVLRNLHTLLGNELRLSQVHHNCIMTKQPSYSSSTGWHQDIRYWAFERGELISAWLALGPEFPDNGCLSFLPGTHRMEIANERFDDAKFLRTDLPENQKLIATRVTPELEAGDVVLFHCRTFHAAGNNRTDRAKWSIVFTYHALDDRPIPGTRSASLPSIAV
jgi:phytanoyl-CoA hydroxylase